MFGEHQEDSHYKEFSHVMLLQPLGTSSGFSSGKILHLTQAICRQATHSFPQTVDMGHTLTLSLTPALM